MEISKTDISDNLSKTREKLKCLVCQNVVYHPRMIIQCKHSFCLSCIDKKEYCPQCEQRFSVKTDLFDNTYLELLTNCLFRIEDIINSNKNTSNINLLNAVTVEKPNVKITDQETTSSTCIGLPNSLATVPNPKYEWSNAFVQVKKNSLGESKLHKACITGKVDLITQHIQTYRDVNITDNYGWTPLHEAVKCGRLDVCNLLIEAGANINVPNKVYVTPLHHAITYNHPAIVKLLLLNGASLNCRNLDGEAPDSNASEHLQMVIKNAEIGPCPPPLVLCSQNIVIFSKIVTKKEAKGAKTNYKMATTITDQVTHYVLSDDISNVSKRCDVSLETLSAILIGAWIVVKEWFSDYISKNALNPEPYEVRGTTDMPLTDAPRKSRICRHLLGPRLFDGCNIYVHGVQYRLNNNVVFSKQDIINLVKLGGGTVLVRCPSPEFISKITYPFHAKGKLERCSHYIICLGTPLQPEYRFPEIHTLHVSWLLKWIQKFEISMEE